MSASQRSGGKKQKVDLKIILLGAAGVGKTSLVQRYTDDEFSATQSTIGASFVLKLWRGRSLGIWDTAGQEKYDALSSFYTRGAEAAILVFDLTDEESFHSLDKYIKLINDNVPNCYKILVGAKLDLIQDNKKPRAVEYDEAESFSQTLNCAYLETSSLTAFNVTEVFERICCHFFREAPAPSAGGDDDEPSSKKKTDTVKVGEDNNTPPPRANGCACG